MKKCTHKTSWRPGQKNCRDCHAAYQRQWRKLNRPISQEWLLRLIGYANREKELNKANNFEYWNGVIAAYQHLLDVMFKNRE